MACKEGLSSHKQEIRCKDGLSSLSDNGLQNKLLAVSPNLVNDYLTKNFNNKRQLDRLQGK